MEPRPSDAHERPTATDWSWAVIVLSIAGILIFFIRKTPATEFPAGPGPLYFWTVLGAVVIAPAYLLKFILDPRRANALHSAYGATAVAGLAIILVAKADPETVLYNPLAASTWSGLANAQGPLFIFMGILALFALSAWLSAAVIFAKHAKRNAPSLKNEGE